MKFEIKSRWDDTKILFTAEIECGEDTSFSIKLGLAVKKAAEARAYLARADLAGAYLARADLTGADLARAYLAGADLTGADLTGANLAGAYLARADLTGANLARANLAGGIKVFEHTFYRAPIQISDKYFINLWDGFLTIGCESHLVSEWEAFEDRDILEMDGKDALLWWNIWKPILIGMAKATGRENLPEVKKDKVA